MTVSSEPVLRGATLGCASTDAVRVSIVVPVYRGELTLPELLREIASMTCEYRTPAGNRIVVSEVLLVHDCGPDRSDRAIEALVCQYGFVRPIWLSRNFGQHAATLAGMATAVGDWVVTMDEDLQHDPRDIGAMLDAALVRGLQVVYAQPINSAPHGVWRNAASRVAKRLARTMVGEGLGEGFSSFRMVEGEMARSLAAYCSSGVYLDVALRWIVGRVGSCPVRLRCEGGRPTGYSVDRLISHFSRLVRTAGARPLRVIAFAGLGSIGLSAAISGYAIYAKVTGRVPVEGWTSLVIALSFFSGCILTALGVIAEYLAQTMSISMGKPPYVVSSKPSGSWERV